MKQDSYKKSTCLNVIKKIKFEKVSMDWWKHMIRTSFHSSVKKTASIFFGKTTLIKEKNTSPTFNIFSKNPGLFSIRKLDLFKKFWASKMFSLNTSKQFFSVVCPREMCAHERTCWLLVLHQQKHTLYSLWGEIAQIRKTPMNFCSRSFPNRIVIGSNSA